MIVIPQKFFCGEEDNKNFSTLVADAKSQEVASVCANVCAGEVRIQSRQSCACSHGRVAYPKASVCCSELVLPLMSCFHETQAVRVSDGGHLISLKSI